MKKNLTAKASWIALARAFNAIGVILVGAILSRALSKSEYGIYQQIWLIFATLLPLFLLGLPHGIYFFYAKTEKKRNFVLQTLILGFIISAIFTFAFLIGDFLLSTIFKSPIKSLYFQIFSIYVFAATLNHFVDPLLICLEKQKLLFFITIIYVIFWLLGVWWTGFYRTNLKLIFLAVGIAGTLKFLFSISFLIPILKNIHFSFDTTLLKEHLIYSFPLGLNGVVAILAKGLNKIFIAAFFSASQYAVYVNGAIEIPLVPILMSSTTAVLVPELSALFAQGDHKKILKLWHLAIKKVSFVLLPLFVLFWVLAEEIVVFLFSEKYLDSAIYFRIFLLMIPLRCFLETPLLMAGNQTRKIFYGSLADMILNFILCYYLVQTLGIKGPAIAIVITTFLQIGYYLWEAKRLLPQISLKNFLPYSKIILIFTTSLFCGIFAHFAQNLVAASFLRLLLSSLTFGAVGVIILLLIKKIFGYELHK